MASWWHRSVSVTEDEYRANLAGMNTFFGAVLGFVLADVTTERPMEFAQLLVFTAAIVIGILYVSASAKRWQYAVMNLVFIWAMPRITPDNAGELGRLQVTLTVWLLMAVLIELLWSWQRRRDAKRTQAAP